MRTLAVLLALCAASAAAQDVAFQNGRDASFMEVASKAELMGNCFPDCTWRCDQPSCPAVCEPQCEKPTCQLRCEKLPETQCDIRCEKPKCEVRCSRNNCQSGGCPLCENVCLPARCQTVCTPAVPVCKPTCSPPKCTWLCRKPTSCPKPKCSLGCNSKPSAAPTGCGNQGSQCCPCQANNPQQLSSMMEIASRSHVSKFGAGPDQEQLPIMVELAHELRLGNEAGCCPCM